jgi:hypothetical protein
MVKNALAASQSTLAIVEKGWFLNLLMRTFVSTGSCTGQLLPAIIIFHHSDQCHTCATRKKGTLMSVYPSHARPAFFHVSFAFPSGVFPPKSWTFQLLPSPSYPSTTLIPTIFLWTSTRTQCVGFVRSTTARGLDSGVPSAELDIVDITLPTTDRISVRLRGFVCERRCGSIRY